MALTIQDFDHGVDFTGLPNVTGGDLNNGVDSAQPHQDTATTGKGLILVTKDTALNIPDVPDATAHIKWKKYTWQRVPFDAAAPIHYGWNEGAALDGTLLKWLPIKTDLTAIISSILAVNNAASTAFNQSEQAVTLAQTVNGIANNASTAATNALAASTSATAASTAATATANAAKASADAATAASNAATAASAAASTAINSYIAAHHCAFLAEQSASGVDLSGVVAGRNTRTINTEHSDVFNLVTLAAGKITITNAGTYYVYAAVPCYTFNNAIQALLTKDSDNSVYIYGQSISTSAAVSNITLISIIQGVITVPANTTIRVDLMAGNANGLNGKAASQSAFEAFTLVKIEQIA